MGCGSSSARNSVTPDSEDGLGGKGRAADASLSERDRNFRTLVYKKRRLSDSTLEKLVSDPIVSAAFRDYLANEFGEQKLLFWLSQEQYRKLGSVPLKEWQQKAAEIYNKYVADDTGTGFDIELDRATREQISLELQVKPMSSAEGEPVRYQVHCSDEEVLKRAFLFAGLKTFQSIKFTYLPVFLTSKNFSELRGEDGFFKDVDDVVEKSGVIAQESMDTAFILGQPLGLHYLLKYVEKEHVWSPELGPSLATLFMEIHHYESNGKAADRFKRLERIAKRYRHMVELPALQEVIRRFDEAPDSFRDEVPTTLLSAASAEVIAKFAEVEAAFKEHDLFKQMTRTMATSSVSDFSKVTSFAAGRSQTKQTIKDLNEFARLRNLSSQAVEEPITLERVLAHSQGLLFFKRFATQHFCEDSILFWIEVQKFKANIAELEASDFALMQKAGAYLVKQFVAVDSPMQVNVSDAMRESALERFNDPAACGSVVFDAAQAEILKLLKENLWKKFQSSPRFSYLESRLQERNFIRETQGHVGQETLDARRRSSVATK